MYEFDARLHDGLSSRPRPVRVRVDSIGQLSYDLSNGVARLEKFESVKVTTRISNTPRYLTLPDGVRLETLENDLIDECIKRWGKRSGFRLYRMESSVRFILAGLMICALTLYVTYEYIIPAGSSWIVGIIPPEVDNALGDHAFERLNESVFGPSSLSEEKKREIQTLFQSLLRSDEKHYRLEFRDGGYLGANAFAFPNGTVLLTDEFVALSEDVNDLSGVLLHEIGHINERHGMQAVVRNAGLSGLIVVFTGDLSSASSMLVLFPAIVLQAKYSRGAESEADDFALTRMLEEGLDTESFASILEKATGEVGNEGSDSAEYFSSHPSTKERAEKFRKQVIEK